MSCNLHRSTTPGNPFVRAVKFFPFRFFTRAGLALRLLFPCLHAELTVWDAPEGSPENALYRVAVRTGSDDWRDVFVYDAVVGEAAENHMGFVSFGSNFSEPVEMRIRRQGSRSGEVRVRPESSGVRPAKKDGDVFLTLTRPVKVSVEFDGDRMGNLLVFANPPVRDPPKPDSEGVIHYGPGIHLLGGDGTGVVPIKEDDTTVYIAGGAVVYGRIDTGGRRGIRILGRGILCGSRFDHDRAKERPQLVYIGRTQNVTLEGIILLDAPGWNIHLHEVSDARVENVKILAWNTETDGINPRGSQNLVVDDCLIRTGDDSISIKLGNATDPGAVTRANRGILVKNSILWPDRAHALLIGPEGDSGNPAEHVTEDVRFQNIDILRVAEKNPEFYGALSIMASDRHTIRNITFEDIRVAQIESGNLIDIRFVNNVYTADYGRSVENITFRNITLEGENRFPNRIHGHDAERGVRGVRFENLNINGRRIEGAEQGGFDVNDFVKDVDFLPESP